MVNEELISNLVKSKQYRKALSLPEKVEEKYRFLAAGEYNLNYVFRHPVWNKKLVLRINYGSQMKLENQIEYEAYALSKLRKTGRTPKVYYMDSSKKYIDKGILVMDYLKGRPLDYKKDILKAAHILADIHSLKFDGSGLIQSKNDIGFILDECESMLKVYTYNDRASEDVKQRLEKLLNKARGIEKNVDKNLKGLYKCIVNTELNSSNFLIGEGCLQSYLIDWEKPIFGLPAQDLGHFLAPTTTFWKTDVILQKREFDIFIDEYIKAVNNRFDTSKIRESTYTFIKINCIRGLTWCAMAYTEYLDESKNLRNESTRRKLNAYLSDDFIKSIEDILYEDEV